MKHLLGVCLLLLASLWSSVGGRCFVTREQTPTHMMHYNDDCKELGDWCNILVFPSPTQDDNVTCDIGKQCSRAAAIGGRSAPFCLYKVASTQRVVAAIYCCRTDPSAQQICNLPQRMTIQCSRTLPRSTIPTTAITTSTTVPTTTKTSTIISTTTKASTVISTSPEANTTTTTTTTTATSTTSATSKPVLPPKRIPPPQPPKTSSTNTQSTNTLLFWGIGAVAVICIVILLMMICCCRPFNCCRRQDDEHNETVVVVINGRKSPKKKHERPLEVMAGEERVTEIDHAINRDPDRSQSSNETTSVSGK